MKRTKRAPIFVFYNYCTALTTQHQFLIISQEVGYIKSFYYFFRLL